MNKAVALAAVLISIVGCTTRPMTPEEIAARKAEWNDLCRPSTMGPAATVWCAHSGEPAPVIMPGRMQQQVSGED